MKILVIILVFSISFSSCQERAVSKINPSKQTKVSLSQVDRPTDVQMTFDATEWDFGEIIQGDVVAHAFEFTNTGKDPLIITDAKGSCGCTVPEWPKAPIAPGEQAEIKVQFNSRSKPGVQNKTVTVTANTYPKVTRLKIKANVNKANPS